MPFSGNYGTARELPMAFRPSKSMKMGYFNGNDSTARIKMRVPRVP